MLRICLDLNVWCGAFIAARLGRTDTAALSLTTAVRTGVTPRGPVGLIVSWGMLDRLRQVLAEQLNFSTEDAQRLTDLIAEYAREGPSLTLGGAGVLTIHDAEDQHVLETAWAGRADILVTQNLADFTAEGTVSLLPDKIFGLTHGAQMLIVCDTFSAAAWLRGEDWPESVSAFLNGGVSGAAQDAGAGD